MQKMQKCKKLKSTQKQFGRSRIRVLEDADASPVDDASASPRTRMRPRKFLRKKLKLKFLHDFLGSQFC